MGYLINRTEVSYLPGTNGVPARIVYCFPNRIDSYYCLLLFHKTNKSAIFETQTVLQQIDSCQGRLITQLCPPNSLSASLTSASHLAMASFANRIFSSIISSLSCITCSDAMVLISSCNHSVTTQRHPNPSHLIQLLHQMVSLCLQHLPGLVELLQRHPRQPCLHHRHPARAVPAQRRHSG